MSSVVHSFSGLLGAALPIVAIVAGMSFAAYSMYLRVCRQRETLQMYHAERMAAIEKGIELPPLPPELLHGGSCGAGYRGGSRWQRRSGLTLLFIGMAVTVAMWQSGREHDFWWGLVIVAWGLGRLVSDHLDAAGTPPQAGSGGAAPPGATFNR